jgi:hypothetical protein
MAADSVHSDKKTLTAQAIRANGMVRDSRLTTIDCHPAVCFISQSLDASTPTTQEKLMLISAVAAVCGSVDSIYYFTVKE